MSLLTLSLVFSMCACGKTTSEKAAEKAQKELGLSDDEAAELKEVYDDVLEEDTADTTAESETESSEEAKELKSYELKDEVKNADASELLFQVDDIVLRLDGSMTFHDAITAFESNEEEYIWDEADSDNVFDNAADVESTLMGAGNWRQFTVCKVISEDSDTLEIACLSFKNPTNDAIETSASVLAGIKAPYRSEEASYYFWLPGGISLTDTSDLTWDNAGEMLEKAGYLKTITAADAGREQDYETMIYDAAMVDGVPAFYYKESDKLHYICWMQNQYNQKIIFIIDFSQEAADKGLGSPLIESNIW